MLYQIKATQTEEYQQRLWFTDQHHDLFIWLDSDYNPLAFQFCYNKLHDEHAVLWHRHHGYSHQRIDSGEPGDGNYKVSPILLANGHIEPLRIAAGFKHINSNIDRKLADFVYQKLLEYAD
ncbi:MAG: hypothetical protein OQL09_06195 [Gammaproteobacteria bacterium]|nr:hypothetical protein [Gammaproteobacteria bacterium]